MNLYLILNDLRSVQEGGSKHISLTCTTRAAMDGCESQIIISHCSTYRLGEGADQRMGGTIYYLVSDRLSGILFVHGRVFILLV